MEHYHVERNHQGIGNELIDDQRGRINMTGGIERRERLGGMLNYYYKEGRVDVRPSFGTQRRKEGRLDGRLSFCTIRGSSRTMRFGRVWP